MDVDGKSQYSEIRTISFIKDAIIVITPNPAHDYIHVNLLRNSNTVITVQLSDVNGKVLSSQYTIAGLLKLDIHQLVRGTYFIKVIDGENVNTQKVVIE